MTSSHRPAMLPSSRNSFAARLLVAAAMLALTVVPGCAHRVWRVHQAPPDKIASIDSGAPFLRCHLKDGGLVVFQRWRADANAQHIAGEGLMYGPDRGAPKERRAPVPFREIAIFDTMSPNTVRSITSVAFWVALSAASGGIAAWCIGTGRCGP